MKKFITVVIIVFALLILSVVFNSKPDRLDSQSTEQLRPIDRAMQGVLKFAGYTGFYNATAGHIVMLIVGLFFIFLDIKT